MSNSGVGGSRSQAAAGGVLSKVPQVTVFFWVIKVLCTTVGETFSDFLGLLQMFGTPVEDRPS